MATTGTVKCVKVTAREVVSQPLSVSRLQMMKASSNSSKQPQMQNLIDSNRILQFVTGSLLKEPAPVQLCYTL